MIKAICDIFVHLIHRCNDYLLQEKTILELNRFIPDKGNMHIKRYNKKYYFVRIDADLFPLICKILYDFVSKNGSLNEINNSGREKNAWKNN